MTELTSPQPNEILASEVLQSLKESNLVPENKEAEVLKKLISGTATQQDWRLWIDLAEQETTQKASNV
jgi:hypothetical protein